MSVAIHPRPPPTRQTPVATQKMPAPRIQARPRPAVAAKPEPPSTPSTPSSASASSASTRPRSSTLTAPPAGFAMPGKDVSSSTGKIFAKPSKEWVLPERAKPGRKASTQEPESKRQSQNRLSQRAHRARRTDYIQTLEERLRKYEADEIHSNVRLQEVARALKGDNDKLKSEVVQLRSALAAARKDRESWAAERRTLTDSVRVLRAQVDAARHSVSGPSASAPSPHLDERIEYELAALTRSPVLTPSMSPLAATPRPTANGTGAGTTPARRPSALACPICPDPDPDCPCQQEQEPAMQTNHRLDSTLVPANTFSSQGSLKCGMCELVPEACLCADEDIKPVIRRSHSSSPGPSGPADSPDCGLCTNDSFCACRAGAIQSNFSSAGSTSSRAEATPIAPVPTATVAAPAVPLRLRARPAARQSLWTLTNVPAGTSRAEAVCTGDPSNCDACRDDSFGREFCGHLFGKPSGAKCAGCTSGKCGSSMSVASLVHGPVPSSGPSTPRVSSPVAAPLVLACCGAPELCGHAAGCGDEGDENDNDNDDSTLRPDEAWKRLKAHPNARFTPLAVLADVVARRAKCDGPRVELSPPPPDLDAAVGEKRRAMAVESSAVRDALKYLDTHTPAPDSPRKRRRV